MAASLTASLTLPQMRISSSGSARTELRRTPRPMPGASWPAGRAQPAGPPRMLRPAPTPARPCRPSRVPMLQAAQALGRDAGKRPGPQRRYRRRVGDQQRLAGGVVQPRREPLDRGQPGGPVACRHRNQLGRGPSALLGFGRHQQGAARQGDTWRRDEISCGALPYCLAHYLDDIVDRDQAANVAGTEQQRRCRHERSGRPEPAWSCWGYAPGEPVARVHQLESAVGFLVEGEGLRAAQEFSAGHQRVLVDGNGLEFGGRALGI